MGGTAVAQRVVQAAAAAIAEHGYASAIDVYVDIGWLAPADLDRWQQGRVQCLERVVHASLPQADVRHRGHSVVGGTAPSRPSETAEVAHASGRRPLRFSVGDAAAVERAYRRCWSPEPSAATRDPGQGVTLSRPVPFQD